MDQTTSTRKTIDIDRLLGALEDSRPTDEPTGYMAAWTRGYNAALRTARAVVKAEVELSRYARPVMVRAAALADEADWTPSIDADYPR